MTRGSVDVPTWPAEVAAGYRRDGVWEDVTLFERFVDAVVTFPGREALIDADCVWTYADLLVRVEALAAGLRARLNVGDRLLVHLPNRAETVLTTLACLAAGIVPVWTLPQHREHELTAFGRHCEARAIITINQQADGDNEAVAHTVQQAVPTLRHVIVVGRPCVTGSVGLSDLMDLSANSSALVQDGPESADSIAVLIPSGGTTGASKIVPRTHNDLGHMLRWACNVSRFDHTSRYLVALPLGHGFANTGPGVLGTLMVGGAVIVSPTPAPEKALALAARHRATATSVVPAILRRWVDHVTPASTDSLPFVLVQVGAAYLDPALAGLAEDVFGCTVQQVYGMSEGLTCVTRIDDPPEVRHHMQGWPISPHDEVRLVDDAGKDVEAGQVGTVTTRGPYTIRGYYLSPDVDARSFTSDGWYLTSDLATRDADGRLTIKGRTNDTINRGGEKVSAEEVEQLIRQLQIVDDCAVVGMPDPEFGEEVCMFITGASTHLVDLDSLTQRLVGHGLAAFKVPKRVVPIGAIPLTGIGKVDRKRLRYLAAHPGVMTAGL